LSSGIQPHFFPKKEYNLISIQPQSPKRGAAPTKLWFLSLSDYPFNHDLHLVGTIFKCLENALLPC
jgi:hypothetical protein